MLYNQEKNLQGYTGFVFWWKIWSNCVIIYIMISHHPGGYPMTRIHYRIATQKDIDFIALVDEENMAALHGAPRSWETWQALLADPHTIYYIVYGYK